MAVQVRVELNSEGIRRFLREDEGIAADLQARGAAVAAAANGRMPNPPATAEEHFAATVWVGHDRQRASVRTASPEARRAEAQDHVLLSSVDAARSP